MVFQASLRAKRGNLTCPGAGAVFGNNSTTNGRNGGGRKTIEACGK